MQRRCQGISFIFDMEKKKKSFQSKSKIRTWATASHIQSVFSIEDIMAMKKKLSLSLTWVLEVNQPFMLKLRQEKSSQRMPDSDEPFFPTLYNFAGKLPSTLTLCTKWDAYLGMSLCFLYWYFLLSLGVMTGITSDLSLRGKIKGIMKS